MDIAETIGAAIIDHFSGDREENDDFIEILNEDDTIKVAIKVPDVVVSSISDTLRSHRMEMLPEMILHRLFDPNAKERVRLVSRNRDTGEIYDKVDPGKAISKVAFKWLMKMLRKGRIAQEEE